MPHPLVSQLYFTRSEFQHWYHTGENMAIRQSLKNEGLQDFVGNIDDEAPYQADMRLLLLIIRLFAREYICRCDLTSRC